MALVHIPPTLAGLIPDTRKFSMSPPCWASMCFVICVVARRNRVSHKFPFSGCYVYTSVMTTLPGQS